MAMAMAMVLALPAFAWAQAIAPFSTDVPGPALPAGWEPLTVPNLRPNHFDLVEDGGQVVLRVRSAQSASSLAFRMDADPAKAPILAWRWKVDRVVAGADLSQAKGDDFAARVYVSFDVPLETLSMLDRAKFQVARLLYGATLPTAALCYVWDNRNPPGTTAWNAYSRRLRMVVVRSGAERAGQWVAESRDLEADFRAAFGAELRGPVPRVTGVALGADTDQTGEVVTAWFGDVTLGPRP